MPKEGRKTAARTVTKRTRKTPAEAAPSHRRKDIGGIVLLGLALVVLIVLLFGNGGLLGDAVTALINKPNSCQCAASKWCFGKVFSASS